MSSVTDNLSPVLVSTKPILILCKCVGVCCLSNLFGNSHTRLLKYNLLSVGIIYQLFFVLYYQIYFSESIWSLLYYRRKAHFVTLLSFFTLVMFLECISSDKKLLKFLKSVEEIDVLVKKILPLKYKTLINLDVYKWAAGIFMFDVVVFFDRDCHWDISKCFKTDSLHSIIFHHLPYLSVISLFCTMCDQLVKRFQLVNTMMIENQDGLEEPFYLEECRRSLYSLVVESTEIFLEWISLRITNHFILITLYSICQICFPCFYGNGCILTVVILRISQQMIMVCLMCYSASKLNEKSQEILSGLLLIPLGKSPYNCKDQIEVFIDLIIARPLKVSAFGLFDVDMTTIPNVFSVILMYTVVVAQLADRLEVYFVLH